MHISWLGHSEISKKEKILKAHDTKVISKHTSNLAFALDIKSVKRIDCLDHFFEGCSRLEVTQEVEIAEETSLEDAKSYHRKPSRGIVQPTIQKLKPVSLELLPQVRINVQPETPISTLTCMVMSSTSQLS